MPSRVGKNRVLTNPSTGEKKVYSVITEEIICEEYNAGEWGKYIFAAWLEKDINLPDAYFISLPYWRNGRFAGQYTIRTEPKIMENLFKEMEKRGWFEKKGIQYP